MIAPVEMDIALDRIDTTGGTQMRVRIDDATVLEYRDAMLGGAEFPPIVVFAERGKHWLADGFHRYRARMAAGARDIRCSVHVGDRTDALVFAVGANQANGLRRTNADKQMAIRAALSVERLSGMSDRALAELLGVTDKSVSAMRAPAGAELPQLKRKGADGKTYPAPKSQAPRVAARGGDHPKPAPNVRRAAGEVNEEAEGPRVAVPAAKQRTALVRGEDMPCPHCGGTGRIRGIR